MSELALTMSDPERKDAYLKRVMEAGNSLLSIINDILDFSKIEARKLALEAIDFDVKKLWILPWIYTCSWQPTKDWI